MSMFSIFNISGSAVSAQSQRLNVVASNLANVDAVAGPDGSVYKARQVVFQTVPMGNDGSAGVKVNAISEDNTPGRRIHDPSNPLADGGWEELISGKIQIVCVSVDTGAGQMKVTSIPAPMRAQLEAIQ